MTSPINEGGSPKEKGAFGIGFVAGAFFIIGVFAFHKYISQWMQ